MRWLVLAVALVGCGSQYSEAEERDRQGAVAREAEARQDRERAEAQSAKNQADFDAICGHPADDPQLRATCAQWQMHIIDSADRAADRAREREGALIAERRHQAELEIAQRQARSQAIKDAVETYQRPYQAAPAPSHCTSLVTGSIVTTNCY